MECTPCSFITFGVVDNIGSFSWVLNYRVKTFPMNYLGLSPDALNKDQRECIWFLRGSRRDYGEEEVLKRGNKCLL